MSDLTRWLEQWRRTVEDVEQGYALTYDDYLNDLDVRHALRGVQPGDAAFGAVAALDTRFREATYPAGACVWGEENAEAEAWDRDAHWYYWRLPRAAGPAFEAEY